MSIQQKLYVHPATPYLLLAFGGLLVLSGTQQLAKLAVNFYHVEQDTVPWSSVTLIRQAVNVIFYCALGGLFIAGGKTMLAAKREAKRLRERYHDQPWMCHNQWAVGHIQVDHRWASITFAVAMICLLAFLLVCVRTLLVTPPAERSYWMTIVVTVISLIVIRGYLLNRKWRCSELRLGTIPGVIGGPFEAVVILTESIPTGTAFRVTLKCESSEWSIESEHSDLVVNTLWQGDVVINKFLDTGMPGKTGLPVYFAIPFDCPETTLEDVRQGTTLSSIQWSLVVKRDDDGDFRSVQFHVPVFVTETSSPDYREDTRVLSSYSELVTAESVLNRIIFRCQPLGDGERLDFSLRSWFYIIAAATISAGSAVTIVAIASWLSPWPLVLIAALVPASVFVVCMLAMLDMLLWNSTVTIQGDSVEVEAGYPGMTQRMSLPREDVIVDSKIEFTTPNIDIRYLQIKSAAAVAGLEAYMNAIEIDNEDDEPQGPPDVVCITVIKRIRGRQAADILRKWLVNRIGGDKSNGG